MRLREGPVQLAIRLGIAPSTVHRILTTARLNRLLYADRATGEPVRRYEHPYTGSLVHVDVKKLGNTPPNPWHKHRTLKQRLLVTIDTKDCLTIATLVPSITKRIPNPPRAINPRTQRRNSNPISRMTAKLYRIAKILPLCCLTHMTTTDPNTQRLVALVLGNFARDKRLTRDKKSKTVSRHSALTVTALPCKPPIPIRRRNRPHP